MIDVWEAREIVKSGRSRITWASRNLIIFEIKTDLGNQEVYLRIKEGNREWDCNVIWREEDGMKWGCMMDTKSDKSKPYCTHTLSCAIVYEQWLEENQWKLKNQ